MYRLLLRFSFTLLLVFIVSACEKINDGDDDKKTPQKTSKEASSENESTGTGASKNKGADANDNSSLVFNAPGHVDLWTFTEDGEEKLLLVSLVEWRNVPSSFSTDGNNMRAKEIATAYCEGDYTDWRIPTKAEAREMKARFGSEKTQEMGEVKYSMPLLTLNEKLSQLGGHALDAWDRYYEAFRYLCADADSTFSLMEGTNVTKAGKSTKYALRLVKTIKKP